MSKVTLPNANETDKSWERESDISSTSSLAARILGEVDTAKDRVKTLRKAADQAYDIQSRKCQALGMLAEQAYAILKERIGALLKTEHFADLTFSEKEVSHAGMGPRGFGKHITIAIPHSDSCLAKVILDFHLDGDLGYDSLVLDYKLEIIPVYLKFKGKDQYTIPVNAFSINAATTWIDDKLVEFVRTYFEIYFSEYYQSKSIVHDPVLNINFPKAFASGVKSYNGTTYYLFTAESQKRFEDQPRFYVSNR